jgi:predicted nucleic acid-binding protein
VYLDTSTLLRVLLGQRPILDGWGTWERAYTSELAGVEARRMIDRLRLDGILDDAGVVAAQEELTRIEASLGRIRLTRVVLSRASLPMATAVKTLDALHLASALLFQPIGAEIISPQSGRCRRCVDNFGPPRRRCLQPIRCLPS